MITIILDFSKKLSHPTLSPIFSNDGKYVTKNVGFGDGTVYVRDNDFVVVVPQENMALASTCSLISGGNGKYSFVTSISKIQFCLEKIKSLVIMEDYAVL